MVRSSYTQHWGLGSTRTRRLTASVLFWSRVFPIHALTTVPTSHLTHNCCVYPEQWISEIDFSDTVL